MKKKLKIAIDSGMMDGRIAKGTAIVIRRHLENLVKYKNDFDITLVHKFSQPNEPIYKEFNEIVIPRIWNYLYGGVINEFIFFISYWIQILLGKKEKFDIYFICYSRLLPSFIFAPSKHFMYYPMDGGPATSVFKGWTKSPFSKYIIFFKRKIDRFLAISEFGKKGIMKVANVSEERVPVVLVGTEEIYVPTNNPAEVYNYLFEKYKIPKKYILCVSRWDPHKNILGLIQAYSEYRKKVNDPNILVFVGGRHLPDYSLEVDNLIAKLDLKDFVVVAPYIYPEDMPKMYQAAEFMVYPSFYEGSGMPTIEAMACGCAAVLSDIEPMRQYGGEAGIYAFPYDISAIANALIEMHVNQDKKKELIKIGINHVKQFTWENSTKQLVEVFKSFEK